MTPARTCNACRRSKPVTCFSRDYNTPGGRAPRCKTCEAARLRKYRRDNTLRVTQSETLREARRALRRSRHRAEEAHA